MSKSTIPSLVALSIFCAACSGILDPWNNNPGGDPFYPADTTVVNPTPGDTIPSVSGVIIDDEATSEDNVANTIFDATISITFNGSEATVSGSADSVTIVKNGAHVTVTNYGEKKVQYFLSGTSEDGCFKLYGARKQAIVFNGLNLTNPSGAAVNNQCKKRTFIISVGDNTIKDGSVNASGDYPEQTADEDMKAAIFSEGQLVFSGSGTLTVTAVGKSGITSDDYVRFMSGSNVTVNSSKGHGVRGKDAIIVSGGAVNVTLETGATGKKCFTTDSLLYIGGGATVLTNKASAGTIDSELTGAACIKADGLFVMKGGQLTATATGKGCKCISCDGNGYFEGGKVIAKATGANYGSSSSGMFGPWGSSSSSDNSSSSKALKFDGNLQFLGSEVTASASSHEAIEAKGTILISSGSISATSGDDAINSASTMTITGGTVYAYSTGNDGLDANGNLYIKGGTVYAIGTTSPEVGIDANTEGGCKFYLQGGNVIAIGGVESNSSVSQAVITTSWNRNTTYSLCSNDSTLFTFKTPASGGTTLFMSAPSLVSGTKYTLKSAATVSGAETYFDGALSIGGATSGGSSTSVSASTYSSNGGGNNGPGGGNNPFGPGWH